MQEELSASGEALKIIGQITALQQVMKNLADMMSPKEQADINFRLSPQESLSAESLTGASAVEMEMVSFVGMSLRKCLRLLQGRNVQIELRGTGRVVSQHPPAGTKLPEGATVTLILERDPVDPGYRRPPQAEPE